MAKTYNSQDMGAKISYKQSAVHSIAIGFNLFLGLFFINIFQKTNIVAISIILNCISLFLTNNCNICQYANYETKKIFYPKIFGLDIFNLFMLLSVMLWIFSSNLLIYTVIDEFTHLIGTFLSHFLKMICFSVTFFFIYFDLSFFV